MEKEANKWITLNRGEYLVTINNSIYKICIIDEKNVTVNENPVSLKYTKSKDDTYELELMDAHFSITFVDSNRDKPQTTLTKLSSKIKIQVNGQLIETIIDDQRSLVAQSWLRRKPHVSKQSTLYAPMPGLITKIMVHQGEIVQRGKVLLVLEAMKMENEIRALQQCKIETIGIHEGSTVERNDELLKIVEI